MSYGKRALTKEQLEVLKENSDLAHALRAEKLLTGQPTLRRFSRQQVLDAVPDVVVTVDGKTVGEIKTGSMRAGTLKSTAHRPTLGPDIYVVQGAVSFTPLTPGRYHVTWDTRTELDKGMGPPPPPLARGYP